MGNKFDIVREWSRNWFAGIGHDEMNPARLEHFSWFWSDEYSAVQKALEATIVTSHRSILAGGNAEPGRYGRKI